MRLSGAVTSTHSQLHRTFVSIESACGRFSHSLGEAGKGFVICWLALLEALVSPL